ncbi:hypothetical protein HX13_20760 [Chryseobacterium sp. P1-3]|uniref:hypothetical protein n=1 Tax=Chryseobacterium sp. (strain P1-3) TaxID=1517683 RepID=UPI0004E7113D|nr:hypothetical protein [Chryseobacterium sp. P1-3]KFF73387.1 hypothetical protein HX13_20760 [Chryseobacterium sp. P1-3]
MGLNFRIVKYSEKFLEKEAGLFNKKIEDIFDKACFVTDGYSGLITDFSIKKNGYKLLSILWSKVK